MIKNEEYIDFLKKVIACVSNGDYYSVKELSVLKLDNLKKDTNIMEKELDKYVRKSKCKKELKNIKNNDIIFLVNKYVEYLFTRIEENKELEKIVSIEEFMQKIT